MNQGTSQPDNITQTGNFVVGVNKGTFNQNGTINESNVTNEDSLEQIINEICQPLSQQYSHASESEKQILLKLEIQNNLNKKPQIKGRFLNALKAGSSELAKVFTDNPFVSVPLGIVRGWFDV